MKTLQTVNKIDLTGKEAFETSNTTFYALQLIKMIPRGVGVF